MSDFKFYAKKARQSLETADSRMMEVTDKIHDQLNPVIEALADAILNLSFTIDELESKDR